MTKSAVVAMRIRATEMIDELRVATFPWIAIEPLRNTLSAATHGATDQTEPPPVDLVIALRRLTI